MPKTKSTFATTAQPYICGGTAAICAAVAIHPIDLVKVHLQLAGQTGSSATASSVVTSVLKKQGITGLYSGLSAAVARQMIYGTARLGMHRSLSNALQERRAEQGLGGNLPLWQKSASAMTTGGIAATLGCPMDVALVRMQADTLASAASRRGYTNVFDAILQIIKQEGVTTLWRGSVPLVARGAAMNFGMMATYDQVKEMLTKVNGDTFSTQLAASGVSGFACAFTSLPFDLVKSRLMNMQPHPSTGVMPYSGVTDCFTQIIKKEGPLQLWRGYWTYYGRCAPNAMIVLLVIERIKSVYQKTFMLEE